MPHIEMQGKTIIFVLELCANDLQPIGHKSIDRCKPYTTAMAVNSTDCA